MGGKPKTDPPKVTVQKPGAAPPARDKFSSRGQEYLTKAFSDPIYHQQPEEPAPLPPPPPPPPEVDPEADATNDRYGNDMAWLDQTFQQPSVTSADALQYGTSADPSMEARQRQAIDELGSIYKQGGNTATDRAARARNRAETENLLQGQNAANMQNMAERGMAGSGAELAGALGASQNAGQRLSSADLQTSADSEQRALSALMGGQQAASGLQNQQNQYVQNNANMLQQAAKGNTDFLRQGYTQMLGNRNNWDLQTMLSKIGVAQGQQGQGIQQQQYGYGQGTGLATGDAGAFTAGQGAANNATLGAFAGGTPGVQNATNVRIGKTGGTQAAAGESASGGVKFVGDFVSGLYGGGGSGGGEKKKEGG